MKSESGTKGRGAIPELSVVVCTYNRADVLAICLESLAKQAGSRSAYEVVVVDNNSGDRTKSVVDSISSELPNLRYFVEKKQGLSHARNRGFQEAAADYVAYIDDDAQVPGDWVTKACAIILEQRPDVFGGSIYPYYLTPKPDWFEDKYEIRIHHHETGWMPADKKRYLSGSNLGFRKALLEEYGGFNPAYGMAGETLAYGEETELVARALRENRRVYHSLELIVYHLVPEHKMHWWYHVYSNYKWGKDMSKLWKRDYAPEAIVELAGMMDSLLVAADTSLRCSVQQRPRRRFEKLLVEEYAPRIREIGRRVGYLLSIHETASLRARLNNTPGDCLLGFREYVTLNLRLLRRTKLIARLLDALRRRS